MRSLLQLAGAYVLLAAQTTAAPLLTVRGVTPNFVFAGLIVFAWFSSARTALVGGVLLGFFADCLASHALGAQVLACTGCVAAVQLLRRNSISLTPLSFVPLGALKIGAALMFTAGLRAWQAAQPFDLTNLAWSAGASALYSALIGGCAFEICRVVSRQRGSAFDQGAADVVNRWTMLTD